MRSLSFLLTALLAASAHAQRVSIPLDGGNFTAAEVERGVSAAQEQCGQLTGAVWARLPSREAECIRYWHAGFTAGKAAKVLVYLPGDQLVGDKAEGTYTTRNPAALQAVVDQMSQRLGVPAILLSRPGILGSSGDHRQRRREPEARLVNAALDAIKARHGISEFTLVGLSGGGHTVASVLPWRTDVACAIPTSAVSSPRMRWEAMGMKADVTGFSDAHEPVEHLKPGSVAPGVRVFVLGDPKDSEVLWAYQQPLALRLKEIGVTTEVLQGEGTGVKRHFLGASGQKVGALCLQGRSTQEILQEAAKGLKG